MLRLLSVTLASMTLFACAAGGPDPSPTKPASSTASSSDGTAPEKDAAKGSSGDDEPSGLGPSCEAYLACCDELAEEQPALAGSCDQTRTAIEDAQEKGASTASYESSCKSALSSMKSSGYCK